MTEIPLVLGVKFFRTDAGNEPVREWLAELPREQRRTIGTDIKTVQLGGPIGMPVLRKLDSGLWEVRTDDNIERVIFTVVDAEMVLLHSFIRRARRLRRSISKPPNSASPDVEVQHTNTHIGSDFDDFLVEQGLAKEVSCAALKRVIAWQVAEAIKAQHISKKALAERMQTSRTVVDRALDQNDAGMTLATLASAWRFDWCRIPLTPGNRRQATIDYEGSRVNRGLSLIVFAEPNAETTEKSMSGINAIGRKQAAMRPAPGENVIFLSYAAIADTSISAAMPESNFSVITALRGYFIGVKPFYLLIIFLRAS